MIEGYVEPVPEFYARLLEQTREMRRRLIKFRALDAQASRRLNSLEGILARLLDISNRELENQRLSDRDYAFIRSFGENLKSVAAGVNNRGLETTIVADVHTDTNSKAVLEEGTGYLRWIVAVYPMPDGGIVAGVGPAFSHYEFKRSMKNRLTDEAWRVMLRSRDDAPSLPEWTKTFSAGTAK